MCDTKKNPTCPCQPRSLPSISAFYLGLNIQKHLKLVTSTISNFPPKAIRYLYSTSRPLYGWNIWTLFLPCIILRIDFYDFSQPVFQNQYVHVYWKSSKHRFRMCLLAYFFFSFGWGGGGLVAVFLEIQFRIWKLEKNKRSLFISFCWQKVPLRWWRHDGDEAGDNPGSRLAAGSHLSRWNESTTNASGCIDCDFEKQFQLHQQQLEQSRQAFPAGTPPPEPPERPAESVLELRWQVRLPGRPEPDLLQCVSFHAGMSGGLLRIRRQPHHRPGWIQYDERVRSARRPIHGAADFNHPAQQLDQSGMAAESGAADPAEFIQQHPTAWRGVAHFPPDNSTGDIDPGQQYAVPHGQTVRWFISGEFTRPVEAGSFRLVWHHRITWTIDAGGRSRSIGSLNVQLSAPLIRSQRSINKTASN